VISGIEVPLELAALLCAACLVAGFWVARARIGPQPAPHRSRNDDPLGKLLRPEVFSAVIDLAARRWGESDAFLARRPRHARDAAVARAMDHVVPASEIEEILLLPAPTPSPAACAA
jgi:hypothetical protein